MKYEQISQFRRDWKKLIKKFRTLGDDFVVAKKNAIEIFHCKGVDSRSIFEVSGVGNTEEVRIFKLKKFACRSLPGRGAKSGMRVIYAYFPQKQKIIFIQIYHKGQNENEDRKRIMDFLRDYL